MMTAAPATSSQTKASERQIRLDQGFQVYLLRNRRVEVAIVPELGAKVISLKNLRTGRDWMWHPPGGLNLFRNQPGDDFSTSPLVGIDECLPTIAACQWQKRNLPDHGEVWSRPATVDPSAWDTGLLKTSVRLSFSPFNFERTLQLHENEILLSYRLTSRSQAPERFLWALHPLLSVCPGDRLILPVSTRALFKGQNWMDALDSAIPGGRCSKLFAAPLIEGFAAIRNRNTADWLEFAWSPAQNNTLGLWRTCGGWHGHEHFAIEPANADCDTLLEASQRNRGRLLPPSGTASWQIRLRTGP